MSTINQSLARNRMGHVRNSGNRFDLTLFEINAGQRLFNLKWAGMTSLRINVIPIIKAKCDVAVLLDFENNGAIAKGVHHTGVDKDRIPWGRSEAREMVVDCSSRECSQMRCCCARLQSSIDAASRLGLKNYPRFRFSCIARWDKIDPLIWWMNLHREHLVDIKKFEKQRKSLESIFKFAKNVYS